MPKLIASKLISASEGGKPCGRLLLMPSTKVETKPVAFRSAS